MGSDLDLSLFPDVWRKGAAWRLRLHRQCAVPLHGSDGEAGQGARAQSVRRVSREVHRARVIRARKGKFVTRDSGTGTTLSSSKKQGDKKTYVPDPKSPPKPKKGKRK